MLIVDRVSKYRTAIQLRRLDLALLMFFFLSNFLFSVKILVMFSCHHLDKYKCSKVETEFYYLPGSLSLNDFVQKRMPPTSCAFLRLNIQIFA